MCPRHTGILGGRGRMVLVWASVVGWELTGNFSSKYRVPTKGAGFKDRLAGKIRQAPNLAGTQNKAEA